VPLSEERPAPDPDSVREALRERDQEIGTAGADVAEVQDDDTYEADDEQLNDLQGG
jgi:hypothetical protein